MPGLPSHAAGGFRRVECLQQMVSMSDQEQAEVRLAYARIKQEHADYDAAIEAMKAVGCDTLQIQRMKKKKLVLKDKLRQIEDSMIPDIIA